MKSRSGGRPSLSDIYLHVAVLQIQMFVPCINFLAVHNALSFDPKRGGSTKLALN